MITQRFLMTALLLATALLHGNCAQAQEEPKPAKIFSSDQVLKVTMSGPWRDIARYKERDSAWPGTFSYVSDSGQTVTLPISITTRGLTRKRVCDFPPLRIDFDKAAAKGTAFRGAGSLKLVTHCFTQSRYAGYYVKEYLGYQFYNRVTEMSFRVQGLDVTYRDSEDDRKPLERFAFLIEDPDEVAKRNGLKKLTITEANPSLLDSEQTTRYVMFQYLIGNLDWSVLGGPGGDRCCHNTRLLGTGNDATTVYPVPYDLDSSGLVDSHYAAPPKKLRVRTIKQRLFRGFCDHNESIPGVVEEFKRLKNDFAQLVEDQPRLDGKEKKKTQAYIDDFYEVLDSEKAMERRFTGSCRG